MRYDGSEEYDSIPPALYDSTDFSPARRSKVKVKNPVPELPESQRIPEAQSIHDHITGNASFTTPNPTMLVFQGHIDDAAAAMVTAEAAIVTARMAVQAKRLAMDALNNDTAFLAAYVDNASLGDEEKIVSSGFQLRAPKTQLSLPPAPLMVEVFAGEFQGQLLMRCQPVANVRMYEYQTTLDPNTESSWVTRGSSSRSSMEVNDLTSGDYCWVRIRALNTAGAGPWSSAAGRTVP
jgi:hypothetical protein